MKVTALQPTIATVIEDAAGAVTAGSGPLSSGTSVHDTATLSGASSSAGGNVTYELFSNDSCTDPAMTVYPSEPVVNGVVPPSPSFAATPGTYSYKAIYSGDPGNAPAVGACEGPFSVVAVQLPVINVVKSEPSPGDGVTVTAGQTTITYKLAVLNFGAVPATSVGVTDTVPTGATYVPDSAGPSGDFVSFDNTSGLITWNVPTVAAESGSVPGEEDLTFKVTVNSADASGSTIVNQASFDNVNTPGCVPGSVANVTSGHRSVALTCLTNTVSNPVTVIQTGGNPQQTTTTTTVKPTTTTTKGALAFTGSRSGLLGALGAGLIGSGGLVLLAQRRRGRNGEHFNR